MDVRRMALVAAVVAGITPQFSGHAAAQTLQGFGNDVPLSFATRQVVPAGTTVTFGPGVDRDTRVSWRGGADWKQVMNAMARDRGLSVSYGQGSVRIQSASAARVREERSPTPIEYRATPIEHGSTVAPTLNRGGLIVLGTREPARVEPPMSAPRAEPTPRAEEPPRATVEARESSRERAARLQEERNAARREVAERTTTRQQEERDVARREAIERTAARDTETRAREARAAVAAPTVVHEAPPLRAPAPVRESSVRETPNREAAVRETPVREPSVRAAREMSVREVTATGRTPSIRNAAPAPRNVVSNGTWRAVRGENLDQVLSDWADRAGWTVVFNSQIIYEMQAGAEFTGEFTEAVAGLVRSVRARPMPVVTFYRGNNVAVVSNSVDGN